MFDKEQLIDILEEQKIVANNNPSNCEHLLFCKKDGTYIIPSQINQIFKRVCREVGIKKNFVIKLAFYVKLWYNLIIIIRRYSEYNMYHFSIEC